MFGVEAFLTTLVLLDVPRIDNHLFAINAFESNLLACAIVAMKSNVVDASHFLCGLNFVWLAFSAQHFRHM